jgi:hypothetical protein
MIPVELLLEANRDHGTRGRVRPRDSSIHRMPIECDGEIVGFWTPHTSACGRQRIGPVYVRPSHRQRGLVLAVYRSITGPMLACIEDGNVASERLHESAGFTRWRRYHAGWYWRRG